MNSDIETEETSEELAKKAAQKAHDARLLGNVSPRPLPAPDAFAVAEEWAAAYYASLDVGGHPMIRAMSAALGLCTRIGKQSGAAYNPSSAFAVLDYGAAIYSWLRVQGVSTEAILVAAQPCAEAILASLAPRESEVKERANFTAPLAVPTI